MGRKFFLGFFVFAVLFVCINLVSAANIAYIVQTPFPLSSDEIIIKNLLENDGHSVVILDDAPVISSLYDIIIVGEDVSNIKYVFDNKNSKTLFLSYKAAKYAGLSKYSGYITTGKELNIESTEHFITDGIGTGTKTVYEELSTISHLNGCKAKNSISLAYESEKLESSLFVLDENSVLLDARDESIRCSYLNVPINERNVFFGLPKASVWNYNSEALFINSIDWLIHGSDADEDGFYSSEDCDENNASINPDAEEIPYNNIDEDCDGEDLADVDGDGYCKQNYEIKNKILQCPKEEGSAGTDCNDNSASINPGSLDIYKNCKNDAPMITEDIEKITVYETEIVEIEINAVDPENDALVYSINDSRFSKDDNVFTWETDYDDKGTYLFKFSVSDGSLSDEIEVEVEVKNTNRAPSCTEIPDVVWEEDEEDKLERSLDLKNYCHDDDGDTISYYIKDTSSEPYVSIDSLLNGVVEFSSQKDWNGEDWVIFKISDGKDYTLTNKIALKVLPVNDAPFLKENLANITWDEDTNLVNYLNLNNYFSDVDKDLLSFDVVGSQFVNIVINNGAVSFYPQKDWNGELHIFFTASDSEFSVNSNAITLKVLDMNEPPEFGVMDCGKEILEDIKYECELNASDFENNAFSFSVASESNLDCSIQGNKLEYISKKDYNGSASCLLRVSDAYGHNDYLFEVNIEGVNDAPVIKGYSPQDNPKIMENTDKLFSIVAEDIDSKLDISWFLKFEEVGTGNSYLFNKEKGNYDLTALVKDGEFSVSHLWKIFVGDISDFTCEEVGGHVCSGKEVCAGTLLGVKDTASCCEAACTPKFDDIKRCKSLSEKIKIEITEPEENEDFMIKDTIKIKADIENNADEDLKLDVETHLYNTDEDESIEKEKDSVSIDAGESEDVEFAIEIPENLDEEEDYAIFVKASDGDYCNENFAKINVEREEYNVVAQEINLEEGLACGKSADVSVDVRNMGSEDLEEVSVKIENSELGISEESGEFELERYDEDDKATQDFRIKIPDNAEAGTYKLKVSAVFEDGRNTQEKEIILGECEPKEEIKEPETTLISLDGEKTTEFTEESMIKGKNIANIVLIALLVLSMIIVIVLAVYLVYLITVSS